MQQNQLLGLTIAGASLKDKKSITEAFQLMVDQNRFDSFKFVNNTANFTAKLVLFTGHDESGYPLRPGYVYETGVTVGGVNVTEHSAQITTLQPQIKCLATRVKCSAQLVRQDGFEQQFDFPDHVAPAGQYFINAIFGIQNPSIKSNSQEIEAIVELVDSSGNKQSLTYTLERVK
jgi:hypothetical protein